MNQSLKKTSVPRPPASVQKEKLSDFRKKTVRPIPIQMFPAISPLVEQGIKPPRQHGVRLPFISHKSVIQKPEQKQKPEQTLKPEQKQKPEQKPGTLKPDVLKVQIGKKKKVHLGVTEAIKKYGRRLTEFEKKEILGYSEIWYLGLKAMKIQQCDDADSYKMVAHDHIAYRYEVLGVMGEGSFGQVLRCQDHKTNEMVAIKVLCQMEDYRTSMTEVKILEALLEKEKDTSTSTVQMKDHFIFRKHLCITFELLGSNLSDILHQQHQWGFPEKLVRHYARSMLKCLQVLHDEKIIHADLKPENILTIDKEHSDIKVADFGCGCYEDEQVFSCIGTRWYRAPEMLLGQPCGTAIDMWSFGCVLAELNTGRPIFTGQNEPDHLIRIIEVLGMPPVDKTGNIAFCCEVFGAKPKSRPLASILRDPDRDFLDFMRRCLTWDPKKRMTPQKAMQHKWITKGQPEVSTREPALFPPRTHEQPKDSTGEPSVPKPGPGPFRKGGHKALCDERLPRLQNVNSPKMLPSIKPLVKRPP